MHEGFLQQAIELATDNVHLDRGGPYGAVIVKNNQVIAATSNKVIAHTDPTAHAEILAIRQACQTLGDHQLTDCILYSSCEPCPMCMGAIYWARLEQVFFASSRQDAAVAGFDDAFIYNEINTHPNQRHIPMQLLAIETAKKPFIIWQQKVEKTPY